MAERFLTFRANGQLYALARRAGRRGDPPAARWRACRRRPRACWAWPTCAAPCCRSPACAACWALPRREAAAPGMARAIVLDGAAPVALAVDAIEALVSVESDQIETRQAELAAQPGERLKGAFATRRRRAVAKILDHRPLIAGGIRASRSAPARARHWPRRRPRASTERAADDRQRLVSFDVAGQEYAFPLEAVLEVVDAPETLAALPASEELVLGVTPFRDTLLPLLSLRGLLGFPQAARNGPREGRRRPRRRRAGRPAGRPHAHDLPGRCRADREDPAGARGPRRRRVEDRGDLPRRRRPPAGFASVARAAVPGGRHAATERRRRSAPEGENGRRPRVGRGAAVRGVPAGRRRIRPADRGGQRGRARARPDHAAAEGAEIPRRRREPARRRPAGRRPAPPLRHAGARAAGRAAAWSWSAPSATAPA